ncbi:Aste57867_917 [Aphanomyces stellatus]|uniref:Aste57867_917 protein n=1 Tax=Aphanomyces stellatus TaxID=120398 RepID=A0A485K7Y8_9STRA|nr:hypothetical protein As57867_000916 [Aphanomyces stellatus]VFT78141.1 Aste57867_917 [Aphanomyces stellatus]
MKTPLPSNFFKCPPLSPGSADHFKQEAYDVSMLVVQKALIRPTPTISWTRMSDSSGGLQIYRAKDSNETSPHVKLCVGMAEVAGTIDEVIALFRQDTTERAKAYVARFGKGLLDSANLYTLTTPTVAQPNELVAINWMAFKSPVQGIVMPRDCCYLEGQFEFDIDGKRGWVRSLNSIDVASCPDMQQSHGLVRMKQLGAGHVVIESDRPGYLRIAYIVHSAFNLSGPGSDWAIDKAIKRRCASLLDLDTFLRENRLATGKFLLGDQLVPKDKRHACQLCLKKFGLFVSKTNCFKCGEVFCGDCNTAWTVPVRGMQTRIEACKQCALKRPMVHHSASSTSLSRSRSKGSTSFKRSPSSRSFVDCPSPSGSSTYGSSVDEYCPANELWIQEFMANKSLVAVDGHE